MNENATKTQYDSQEAQKPQSNFSIDFDSLTKEELLENDIYEKIFSIDDQITRKQCENKLLARASAFRQKSAVESLLKIYRKVARQKEKEKAGKKELITHFSADTKGVEYPDLYCGGWEATDDGVFSTDFAQITQTVCYHPIMPVKRLKNLQTGEEQITIAFKRNNLWEERTVPKTMIATARSITELSKFGVAVTSENAKLLVRYLSDIENWNGDIIDIQKSTSKLGWHGSDFIPFDTNIKFDGENQFRELFESIREFGEYSVWKDLVLSLRATKTRELRLAIGAAFASVLLKPIGMLPFIVDFWTMTEAGKTVLNMVAASVWGNPAESKYIGDFKTTDIALETRLDMLNNIPAFLDDTSKASKRIRENFEGVVYDICSGKGKTRSNLKLGNDRERFWQTVVICNGERPLSTYVEQGGAINRIIEVECRKKIFDDPARTADIVRNNYGFAGKMFVELVKQMNQEELRAIHQRYVDELTTSETMQKQVIALAAILTADELATRFIFKDGNNLTCEEVADVLTNKNEISDGERCYRFLLDMIGQNEIRFKLGYSVEQWGIFDTYEEDEEVSEVYFYINAFEKIVKAEGYSRNSFTSWAIDNDLLLQTGDRDTVLKKINGTTKRYIGIRVDYDFDSSKEPVFD